MRSLVIASIILLSFAVTGTADAVCASGNCAYLSGDADQWCVRYHVESGPGWTDGFVCRHVIKLDS